VRWSKHGGSSSRLWLAFSLALALCIFSPHPLHAQTVSERTENSDKPKSIEGWLMDSLSSSAQLRQALIAQRSSRIDLEIAYMALKASRTDSEQKLQSRIDALTKLLSDSLTDSDSLRAEIARLTALLIELKTDSAALSKAFGDYRAEMQRQVREVSRERDTWRVVAIVAGAAAVGFGIWAAVK